MPKMSIPSVRSGDHPGTTKVGHGSAKPAPRSGLRLAPCEGLSGQSGHTLGTGSAPHQFSRFLPHGGSLQGKVIVPPLQLVMSGSALEAVAEREALPSPGVIFCFHRRYFGSSVGCARCPGALPAALVPNHDGHTRRYRTSSRSPEWSRSRGRSPDGP